MSPRCPHPARRPHGAPAQAPAAAAGPRARRNPRCDPQNETGQRPNGGLGLHGGARRPRRRRRGRRPTAGSRPRRTSTEDIAAAGARAARGARVTASSSSARGLVRAGPRAKPCTSEHRGHICARRVGDSREAEGHGPKGLKRRACRGGYNAKPWIGGVSGDAEYLHPPDGSTLSNPN